MYQTQLVPTRFEWRYGGRQVHVCGSFTGWQEMVPMQAETAPSASGAVVHRVTINIPPGYHQYKFMVDNEWCHDESQPYMPSPLGPPNNWLHVNPPNEAQGAIGAPGVTPALLVPGATASAAAAPPGAAGEGGNSASGAMDVDMAHGAAGGGVAGGGTPTSVSAGASAQAMSPSGGMASAGSAGHLAEVVANSNRQMLSQFLEHHAVYELLPDSGKVVVLDTRVPLAEAFLAFHEQGITAAPLWDSMLQAFVGMMTASDFIRIVSDFHANPASSWEQVEALSIAEWRARQDSGAATGSAEGSAGADGTAGSQGGGARQLVSVGPDDSLAHAARTIARTGHSTLPVLAGDELASVHCLHLVALPGVLASVVKHFRMVTRSLPLLAQPLGTLPLGTWVAGRGPPGAGRELATMREDAPLSATLSLLLAANVSAVPVVDAHGVLRNVYSRADVTALAQSKAYKRVVATTPLAQVLAYLDNSVAGGVVGAERFHTCSRGDSLRTAMERLAQPGVMRLVVVEEGTNMVEGLVSVSDVVAFLLGERLAR